MCVTCALPKVNSSATLSPVVWNTARRVNLSWNTDLRSISDAEHDPIVELMRTAVHSWEQCCNVKFPYSEKKTPFISLRKATADEEKTHRQRGTIASSFYPGAAAREIILYRRFFEEIKVSQISTLRHEAGHILGFRHEHILSKDSRLPPESTKDALLLTSTEPDGDSVMNYVKLWEDTYKQRMTDLSALDEMGAQRIYGISSDIATMIDEEILKPPQQPALIVKSVPRKPSINPLG